MISLRERFVGIWACPTLKSRRNVRQANSFVSPTYTKCAPVTPLFPLLTQITGGRGLISRLICVYQMFT